MDVNPVLNNQEDQLTLNSSRPELNHSQSYRRHSRRHRDRRDSTGREQQSSSQSQAQHQHHPHNPRESLDRYIRHRHRRRHQSESSNPEPPPYSQVAGNSASSGAAGGLGSDNPTEDPSTARHGRRHRRHHRHHGHGAGKILVKYLRTVARNSLHNLYDELTHTIPPEMSVHYQNIHDYLSNQQQGGTAGGSSASGESPNPLRFNTTTTTAASGSVSSARVSPFRSSAPPGALNEMHEFISTREGAVSPNGPPPPYNPYAPPPTRSGLFPLTDFLQDPLNAGLSTLNKVTQIVRSPTSQIIHGASNVAYNILSNTNHIFTAPPSHPPGHVERIYPNLNNFRGHHQEQFGVDGVEGISAPPPVLPSIEYSRPQNRLEPLSVEEFQSKAWTKEELCIRVFGGGIVEDNQLRTRLWPIILGLADLKDTPDLDLRTFEFDWTERETLYGHYRTQWESVLPDQEKRFAMFRERKSLIERDVIRCDRTHPYYQGESESLESLRALLLTYMMHDFDTGYVQGMSDLASPLLYVADGDVCKSFWFFAKVMDFTHQNFEMSQQTIKLQLDMLWKLIELTDPIFAQYLANNDSVNCYFAFRWIVCQFKREFMKTNFDDYQDVLLLWESIWTCSAMREHLNKLREKKKKEEEAELMEQLEKLKKEQSEAVEESEVDALNPSVASPSNSSITNISVSPSSFNSSVFSLKELEEKEEKENAELVSKIQTSLRIQDPEEEDGNVKEERDEEEASVLTASKLSSSDSSCTVASSSTSTSSCDGAGSSKEVRLPAKITKVICSNNVYVPEVKRLSDTELYVLCICLCIIRRERDLIMANRYDATDILKHFNTLQLNANLKDILTHASNIWSWLVFDDKEKQLYPNPAQSHGGSSNSSLHNHGPTGSNVSNATNGTNSNRASSSCDAASNRNDADDFDLLPDARITSSGLSGEDYFLLNS